VKIALIFPPLADPTQPYSSLPALAAFLRTRGSADVVQLDANIEFLRHSLSAGHLSAVVAHLESEVSRRGPSGDPESDLDALRIRVLLKAPMVVDGIDRAVRDLRRPEVFRDLRRLDRCKRLVQEAIEILTAASLPYDMGFGNAGSPGEARPVALEALARDTAGNPFRDFLSRHTLPRLGKERPEAVGISITYRKQLLPAITLGLLLRERMEGVPVIFGGNIVSAWYDRIAECPEIFDWCDYLIPFEGESALQGLLSALPDGAGLDHVPNLAYRRYGRVVRNPVRTEDMDSLPTPDYDGLPLDLYLAPHPVFLLSTSRGCYWSRCGFCSVSPALRRAYRVRRPDLVQRDIEALQERHGDLAVSFADDCLSPSTLRALSTRMKASGTHVAWQCEVRFEKALTRSLLKRMREAGCLNLIFGLESYSPRVLQLMRKGIEHDQISRILSDCRSLGIAFNLQFFFGFPGETKDEAAATADFALGHMYGAATCSFGTFELQKGSPAEERPGEFGIEQVMRDRGPLAVKFEYRPRPAHAATMRAQLRDRLEARLRHRHAGLSINAHTLLFLRAAGVEALGGLYREGHESEAPGRETSDLMDCPLRRGPRQTVRVMGSAEPTLGGRTPAGAEALSYVLYDHDLDRTVALSPLALWLLHHLDGERTASGLAEQLAKDAGTSVPSVLPAVRGVVRALTERGFLRPGDRAAANLGDSPKCLESATSPGGASASAGGWL
jgi:hypothetical protein